MAISKKQQEEESRKFVFTSKNIEDITEQIGDGVIIKRYQNPWLKNEVGVRRSGLSFGITNDELMERIKCMDDIQYFAEKYCQIKREDGSIGPIVLRNYQKEILELYKSNRVILSASRQAGKCFLFNSLVFTSFGELLKKRIGIIYYEKLASFRPLTFLEKLKIKLYNILYFIDNFFG